MPGYKKALKELTKVFEEKRKEQEDKKLEV